MKNRIFYGLMVLTVIFFTACGSDDDATQQNVIVSTQDFQASIASDLAEGETVGTVTGSSNDGAVTFDIQSQTPSGVLAIGATTGVLTVADATTLSTLGGSQIAMQVNVSKGDVSQTSNVTITVTEAIMSSADVSPWVGSVFVKTSTNPVKEVTGTAGENGILTLTAIDPFTLLFGTDPSSIFCEQEISIDVQLIADNPSMPGAGTVSISEQDYACFNDNSLGTKIRATSGTYDASTSLINIDFVFISDDGTEDEITAIISTENPDPDGDGVLFDDDSAPNDPCSPAQDPGYFEYDPTNSVWADADCDNDGITNGEEVENDTDPYEAPAADSDGDGIADDSDEAPNDPCLPVQEAGYNKYDADNTTWAAADCDGDGTTNGEETTNFTDSYVDDTVACSSTVNTDVWAGDLETEEDFGDEFPNEGSGTGIFGCGTLTFSGDVLGIFCDNVPSVTFNFTPDSAGATTGTVSVANQPYSCYEDIDDDTIEGSGTYDETTATITFDYSWFDSDFDETVTGTVVITKS